MGQGEKDTRLGERGQRKRTKKTRKEAGLRVKGRKDNK